MGRQTTYTEAAADLIVDLLSEGTPLAAICRREDMPKLRTAYDWMDADPAFAARVARARETGFEQIALDALNIANTPHEGVREKVVDEGVGADGKPRAATVERVTEDMLGHRKLQIETRLKLLACWDPKRYGARVNHAGVEGAPIGITISSDDAGL